MVQAQKLFLDIYFSYSDFYGGICMFSTISLAGFISFLSSAVFVVGYIQSSSLFPEPLSPSEEIYYLDKFKAGDNEARNILIEKNLRLVAHVAKKYSTSNIEQDDLISIGTICLLYTSDAADDKARVDLGGRRIIKKIFFKQKTAYEIGVRLVGSEMCIRDSSSSCS